MLTFRCAIHPLTIPSHRKGISDDEADPRILMAEEGVDLVWRNIAAGNLAALTLIRSGRDRKH